MYTLSFLSNPNYTEKEYSKCISQSSGTLCDASTLSSRNYVGSRSEGSPLEQKRITDLRGLMHS